MVGEIEKGDVVYLHKEDRFGIIQEVKKNILYDFYSIEVDYHEYKQYDMVWVITTIGSQFELVSKGDFK